jgi:hypothetical protein
MGDARPEGRAYGRCGAAPLAARDNLLLAFVATPAAAQTTHVAIVVGLAGDPEHAELFRWAATLVGASVKMGVTRDHLVYLAEAGSRPEAHRREVDEGRGGQGVRQDSPGRRG